MSRDGQPIARLKVCCTSVTERQDNGGSVWDFEFQCVMTGSTENEQFFRYTPSGRLVFSCIRERKFVVGQDYYLDLIG